MTPLHQKIWSAIEGESGVDAFVALLDCAALLAKHARVPLSVAAKELRKSYKRAERGLLLQARAYASRVTKEAISEAKADITARVPVIDLSKLAEGSNDG